MNKSNTLGIWLQSGFVFLIFFAYYAFGAYYLPPQAGPDYAGSRAAADFYLTEGRLATVPQDESSMTFSIYGNSRLLRPPLGFATAAAMAKVNAMTVQDKERYYYYRLANALFGALTLALIFATLRLFFQNTFLATFGVLLAGLLPQFAFTSMYLNDDSAAFFAISFLVFIMAWIVEKGVSTTNVAVFALAVGVTVLSKKSAWIFLPAAILFYLIFILRFDRYFFRRQSIMILAFLVGGGWWLGFNMYHYGWNDPFLSNIGWEVTQRHARVDLSKFGFQAEGIHISDLLFGNYKRFIPATYMAVVGHLDWLKLRLGSMQYGFYLLLVLGLVANVAYLLAETILTKFKDRKVQFEWVLYLAVILQIFAYTWANVYRDIQIQGKYLLPIILPILILSLSFYAKLFMSSRHQRSVVSLSQLVVMLLVLLMPIIVHLDAIVDFVIPFYWPTFDTGVLGDIF